MSPSDPAAVRAEPAADVQERAVRLSWFTTLERIPSSLAELAVGPATAREVRWTD